MEQWWIWVTDTTCWSVLIWRFSCASTLQQDIPLHHRPKAQIITTFLIIKHTMCVAPFLIQNQAPVVFWWPLGSTKPANMHLKSRPMIMTTLYFRRFAGPMMIICVETQAHSWLFKAFCFHEELEAGDHPPMQDITLLVLCSRYIFFTLPSMCGPHRALMIRPTIPKVDIGWFCWWIAPREWPTVITPDARDRGLCCLFPYGPWWIVLCLTYIWWTDWWTRSTNLQVDSLDKHKDFIVQILITLLTRDSLETWNIDLLCGSYTI